MPTIKIKDVEIPISIKSYKTSKTIKMYFRNGIFVITKPKYVPKYKIEEMIKKSEEEIYKQYKEVVNKEIKKIDWYKKEVFYYKGQEYKIDLIETKESKITININENKQVLEISVCERLTDERRKGYLDKGIKALLKNKTEQILDEKLPKWSKTTNISYNSVKVRDAVSKYGSCTIGKKALHFSSRLVMLPDNVIDAIIVHELCHIVHPNHSKQFYDLVESYISEYKQIDKWLKENGNVILL